MNPLEQLCQENKERVESKWKAMESWSDERFNRYVDGLVGKTYTEDRTSYEDGKITTNWTPETGV